MDCCVTAQIFSEASFISLISCQVRNIMSLKYHLKCFLSHKFRIALEYGLFLQYNPVFHISADLFYKLQNSFSNKEELGQSCEFFLSFCLFWQQQHHREQSQGLRRCHAAQHGNTKTSCKPLNLANCGEHPSCAAEESGWPPGQVRR